MERLELPRASLRQSVVNCGSTSTEIVQTTHGSIQELGAFDRPEWVDEARSAVC
jgi:hypothetical protein